MLVVGQQEEHMAYKKLCCAHAKDLPYGNPAYPEVIP